MLKMNDSCVLLFLILLSLVKCIYLVKKGGGLGGFSLAPHECGE